MEKTTRVNGNNSIAVASHGGVDHRLNSIEEFTPIRINNLKKGVAYRIDLRQCLNQDYRANVATFDLPYDDSDRLEDFDDEEKFVQRIRLLIRTLKNGVTTSQKYIILRSNNSNIPFLFFKQDEVIVIQPDEDLISMTFYGKPIVLNPTINLVQDSTFKGDAQTNQI